MFVWIIVLVFGFVLAMIESLFFKFYLLPAFLVIVGWFWEEKLPETAFFLGLCRDLARGGGVGKSSFLFLLLAAFIQIAKEWLAKRRFS